MSNTQTVTTSVSPEDAAEWLRHWCAHEWADGPHGPVVARFNLQALRDLAAMMQAGLGPDCVAFLCSLDAALAMQRDPGWLRGDPWELQQCPFSRGRLNALALYANRAPPMGTVIQAVWPWQVAVTAMAKASGRPVSDYKAAMTGVAISDHRPDGALLQ